MSFQNVIPLQMHANISPQKLLQGTILRECAQDSDLLTPQRCVWQEELSRFSQHHSGWQLSLQPFLLRFHRIWIEESAQKMSQLFELLLDAPRCLFAWSDCVNIHSQGGARPHKLTPGLCIAESTGHWGTDIIASSRWRKEIKVLFEFHLQAPQLHNMNSGMGLAIRSWPMVWKRSHFCKSVFLLCFCDIISGKVPFLGRGQCPEKRHSST